MNGETVEECFEEIGAYCSAASGGAPLVVHTENYDDAQAVAGRLEADAGKTCVRVSDCTLPNGLPDLAQARERVKGEGSFVLLGYGEAALLQGGDALEEALADLLHLSIHGSVVALVSHCRTTLTRLLGRDPTRLDRQAFFLAGPATPLPRITLLPRDPIGGEKPLAEIRGLLAFLEGATEAACRRTPELRVRTDFGPSLFAASSFPVRAGGGVYEDLTAWDASLATVGEEAGTTEQWEALAAIREKSGADSFAAIVAERIGDPAALSPRLPEILERGDPLERWILWLGLKIFGADAYLARILERESSCESLADDLYRGILEIRWDDPSFAAIFRQRRELLERLAKDPAAPARLEAFCAEVGRYGREAVRYLTDGSEAEEAELLRCLSLYEYDDEELATLLQPGFPDLALYLEDFSFDVVNTKLPASAAGLRAELTEYFHQYKFQKVTNRLRDDFLERVEREARQRDFLLLQPRSSLVAKIPKEGTDFYFFDALGVEYLSYIRSKCESAGFITEIAVGHGELPSVTAFNKEFLQTCPDVKKISDLDELKHHSSDYNFAKCPLPLHLFEELSIIDRTLSQIQSRLLQGTAERAVILSDHGASRLAVLWAQRGAEPIELDGKGEHAGRCCPVSGDPGKPQLVYENGYAAAADYERIRGGRAANREVHGGGTLEEVLVPVITITKRPAQVTYRFVEEVIRFRPGRAAQITLFCNLPMTQPRIEVGGIFYEGAFAEDAKHAVFTMPEVKRSRTYEAHLYEGEKDLAVTLPFTLERGTKERQLFDFGK